MADSTWLMELLERHPDKFGAVLADAQAFRAQVLVGLIEPAAGGGAHIVHHRFRVDAEYFYPASTVKLCAAVAAMRTLELIREETGLPLSVDTPFVLHPVFSDQRSEAKDRTNLAGGTLTVGHEIRKICLVSDNPAHNRLLNIVGHRALNERMWQLGLLSVRLNHRLDEPRTREENLRTGGVDFLGPDGVMYSVPARTSDLHIDNAGVPGLQVGRAHVAGGKLVLEPMSFLHKNRVSLVDLQNLLAMVVRPELVAHLPGWRLSPADRAFLCRAMTEFPGDSQIPRFERAVYPDHYVKYCLPGLRRVGPTADVRVINKVGQAWGFTIENAYIFDARRGRPFFLTAVIYANRDGVLGTDAYQDKAIAEPFMADLAEVVARHVWM